MRALRPASFNAPWRRFGIYLIACCAALPQTALAGVVDASGWATPGAVEICRLMATAHQQAPPAEAPGYVALAALEAFARDTLRRPPGSERVDAAARARYAHLLAPLSAAERSRLSALFADLGAVGAVGPAPGTYDYFLIQGSTVPSMRRRVMALAEAWGRGDVHLSPGGQVVFLDGERPLFASESIDVLFDTVPFMPDPTFTAPVERPTNEHEAAEMVWRQLWLPEVMRQQTPLFVHASAQPGATRAQTRDVVRAWAAIYRPRPGRALMVSDNPYIDYQRLVTTHVLRAHGLAVSVAAMGGAGAAGEATSDVTLGVQLDNFAAALAEALAMQSLDEHDLQPALTP